jgi:hypothetical protein
VFELLACGRRAQVADPASRIGTLLGEEIDWTYLVRTALASRDEPVREFRVLAVVRESRKSVAAVVQKLDLTETELRSWGGR